MDKIVEKAFRCKFVWSECEFWQGSLIHAENSSKARYKFFLSSECEKEDFTNIQVRRDRDFDLLENEPMAIVSDLTKELLHIMSHTIGHDYHKDPYRNRYVMGDLSKHDGFEHLISLGLANSWVRMNSTIYGLTDEGIRAIKSTKPILRINKLNQKQTT